GLVKRDVVRIVTPGTLLDENSLQKKENNYIVALQIDKSVLILAIADLSTGYFALTEHPVVEKEQFLSDILARLTPSECLLPEELYNDSELLKLLSSHKYLNIFAYKGFMTQVQRARDLL